MGVMPFNPDKNVGLFVSSFHSKKEESHNRGEQGKAIGLHIDLILFVSLP